MQLQTLSGEAHKGKWGPEVLSLAFTGIWQWEAEQDNILGRAPPLSHIAWHSQHDNLKSMG